METQYTKDIKDIMAYAKNFAERHQIIYSDYHERMVLMVIQESLKMASKVVLEQNIPIINESMEHKEIDVHKNAVCYDVDIYKGLEPLKTVRDSYDFNKREGSKID